MTSRIAAIAIDAVDPRPIAEFWTAVLGWQILGEDADGVLTIGPAGAAWPTIDVVPVPERKTLKNRVHLDLRADGSTMAAEVERVCALGATPADVGQAPDSSWTVLADPEGNEFCILSRSVQDVTGSPALQRLDPASAPAPAGKYSQLTIAGEGARVATFSGQIGAPATGAGEQTRQVFNAIGRLLASQGAGPADLIKLTTYVVGRDTLAEFNAVRNEVYAEWFPDGGYPGNTVVLVAGLALESLLVEVEGSFVCR